MANGFVVIAEFEVSAEHKAEFVELCRFDSLRSTTDEAGCQSFDVVTSADAPKDVVLYEVYDDRAAFDAHMAMPHYAVFAAGVQRMGVVKRQVRFFEREVVAGV